MTKLFPYSFASLLALGVVVCIIMGMYHVYKAIREKDKGELFYVTIWFLGSAFLWLFFAFTYDTSISRF